MPVPQNVALKQPQDFKLIGTPAKRLDTPAKVNGTAVYGIDVAAAGMKIATLAQSPVFGGRVKSVDDTAAKAVKGVRQIVRLDDAVAVVADHMGAAKKGLAALEIEWDDGPHAKLATQRCRGRAREGDARAGRGRAEYRRRRQGDGRRRHQGRGELPASVPRPRDHGADELHGPCPQRWLRNLGRQPGDRARAGRRRESSRPAAGQGRAAQSSARRRIRPPAGGRWHRPRGRDRQACRWPGEGRVDARGGHPARHVPARTGSTGCPPVSTEGHAGRLEQSLRRLLGHGALCCRRCSTNGLDPDTTEGAIDLVYDLPNMHVEYVRVEPPGIPTAFWRSVGPSHNVFVTESFMDELAAAAKQDAVAYRRALLGKSPRAKAVLELAAEKSGWGQRVARARRPRRRAAVRLRELHGPCRRGRGGEGRRVRVRRVVCAVDCGTVVNPDTIRAQLQSGVMFGITAALHGEITLKNGRVEQSNFDTYEMLRIDEAPAIEVHIVQNFEPPGGMGEAGTSLIVPAVANAIFAATGKRLRKMPVDPAVLKEA